MYDDDSDDGWGRPRPKFSDLPPSSPCQYGEGGCYDGDESHGGSEDGEVNNDREQIQIGSCGSSIIPGGNLLPSRNTQRVTSLVDLPLYMHEGVPLAELNQTFINEGWLRPDQIPEMRRFYTSWDNGEKSHKAMFTCIFTCPTTGEHFASGHYNNARGVYSTNGVFWYKSKKHAEVAAAAKYLDYLSLQRCDGTDKTPYQRCVDPPLIEDNSASSLRVLPSSIELPAPLKSEQVHIATAPPKLHPKQALNMWYLGFFKKLDIVAGISIFDNDNVPQNQSYYCFSNGLYSPHTLFTALFTCHLSGETFKSGKLVGRESACKEDHCYYDHDKHSLIAKAWGGQDNPSLQRINFVWYSKCKKLFD